MSDLKYNIVFEGKVQDDFDAADVKSNIARLFKISEEKVEQLFSKPRVVLKAGVDRPTADKYQGLMAKAGAVISIEEQPKTVPASASEPPPAPTGPANPPTPPPAPVTPEKQAVGPIWGRKYEGGTTDTSPGTQPSPAPGDAGYGSLERGMAGDYHFAIGETLSEAWRKVRGTKGTIALAYLLYMGIMIGVGIGTTLIQWIFSAVAGNTGGVIAELLAMVVNLAVTAPLMAGLFMLGVRIAVGSPAGAGSMLGYYDRTGPLLLTLVLMYLMMMLGFLLLIIPGIYLSVAYCLALPLVVDKKLSPWQALEASRKAVSRRWFSVLGLFLAIGFLFLLGAIPLLIGLIWIIPMSLIAMGILYRNIFGVSSIPVTVLLGTLPGH
ncbi:MAG: hypothetical protein AB1724_17930 [Thermodesulfobacteriota bacterium]